MYKGFKILGLIPARGGSKGIARKNIALLKGKPLIAYTIEEALKSRYLDKLILSSDDKEIIEVSKSFGCEAPFIRPVELALDHTKSIDVALHAIDQLKDEYDFLVLLQPTSPFRKSSHIDQGISVCIDNDCDALVSVCEAAKSPNLMYYKDTDNFLTPVMNVVVADARRQDLPKTWIVNGALYVNSVVSLKHNKSFKSKNMKAIEMSRMESIDIDEPLDLLFAECLIDHNIV